ncbi:MAG TPA: DUF935 family protein [Bacteroidota bacterium]|nr:DUF935 family protein [Bacteroidota bacterium]
MNYVWAPLQKKLLPSVSEAFKAVQLAEAEQPDPRPLLQTLARLPEVDTRLLGLMQTRQLAVTGFPWEFVPSDPASDRAIEIAQAMTARFRTSGFHMHFNALLNAIFYGHAALECTWGNDDLGFRPIAITPIPITSLYWDGVKVLRIVDDPARFRTEPLEPPEKYCIVTFNPLNGINTRHIGGLLRTALWLSLLKQFNWNDWSHFNEVYGEPLRVAKWKPYTSEEDKKTALNAVKEIGKRAYAAVSEDVLIEFIEATRNGSIEAYERLLKAILDEQSILILGQTLTTDVKDKGTFAAAKVHNTVRTDLMWSDLLMLENAVNSYYVPLDYKNNVGTDAALIPRFRFITDEAIDYESNARIIETLRGAEVPLRRSEVYEKTGFSKPEEGDEVL